MRIQWQWQPEKGLLEMTPLHYRDRLPKIKKLVVENTVTYIVPMELFGEKIALGTIPDGYKLQTADKYKLVFKSSTLTKRTPKKRIK